MSGSGFQLSLLRDGRLAPLATSALPAWLWSTDGNRIVWANAAGAAVFGAPTSAAVGSRRFTRSEPAPAQIARVAATLSPGAAPRLERLRGFGTGIGRALTCACSHILLADDARLEGGYLTLSDRPGIGFEGQSALYALMRELAA